MISGLKQIIKNALRDSSKHELRLIQICTNIAEAYLRTKVRKHQDLLDFTSDSLKDIATDSIAELFQKKENKLIVFERWYQKREIENLEQPDVFIELRKLVFTEVNDHIFKVYKQKDTSLAKIIRNIKRVIHDGDVEGIKIMENEPCICLSIAEQPLVMLLPEILEIKLSPRLKQSKSTLDVIQAVREILETELPTHRKIPITALAVSIRKVFVRLNDVLEDFSDSTKLFEEHELKVLIQKSVKEVQLDMYNSYVLKEKMNSEELARYFYITEQILVTDYIGSKLQGLSFYEHYQYVVEGITKQEYTINNRVTLEYFVKKTRNNLINKCRREINSANKLNWKG